VSAWHLDPDLVRRYVAGTLDFGVAASVESHVLRCAECRDALAPNVATTRIDGIWEAISTGIDAQRPGPVRWMLDRLGALASGPPLRLAWVASAVAVALGSVAVVGGDRPGQSPRPSRISPTSAPMPGVAGPGVRVPDVPVPGVRVPGVSVPRQADATVPSTAERRGRVLTMKRE
jgi:hypothetical protein